MKVKVLFQDLSHGLLWQRIRIPFERLSEKYRVSYASFDDPHTWYDTSTEVYILLHPSVGEEAELIERLRKQGKKVIVDIDDLLDNVPSGHPEQAQLLHCKQTVPECLMKANLVTVSTQFLKDTYRHLNPNIHVTENSLQTTQIKEDYRPVKKPYKTLFTAGWVGGQTHRDDQEEMAKGLSSFLERYQDTRAHFKVICPQRLINRYGARVFFDPKTLHYLDYHQWIATLPWDVCLVPLVDHPFNDAKSDLRFIEMARHKIPVISSPRASFKNHIDEGRILFLGTFYDSLKSAYEDTEELETMAESAFDYVMSNRLDRHAAKKWEDILESL